MATFGRERTQDTGMVKDQLASYNDAYGSTPTMSTPYKSRVRVTRDSIHPNYPKEGGPFESITRTISYEDSTCGKTGSDGNYQIGKVRQQYPLPSGWSWNLPPSKFANCVALGPTAWNRFRPAKPTVSLGVFIAELRDLPGLMFNKLDKFRNLGSNYLAYQFGWRPFLSDIRDWYESCVKLDSQIAQLMRDNGRWIRRGGVLYQNQSSDSNVIKFSGNICAACPHVHPSYSLFEGQTSVEVVSEEKAWFSGAFRYYIPGLTSKKWGRLKAISKLWDLELGPEQVYNLLPFSWLVDWFTNVGDVIGNYSSQMEDNLTAKYAYIMLSRKTTKKVKTTGVARFMKNLATGGYNWSDQSSVYSCGYDLIEENKNRAAASPFGFEFTFDTLSPYQISILSALGLSFQKH